jgi:hypothetical protein
LCGFCGPFFALTDQAASDDAQTKHSADVHFAAQLELAQAAEFLLLWRRLRLDPAKNLLATPAGMDQFGIALLAGGAAIHR